MKMLLLLATLALASAADPFRDALQSPEGAQLSIQSDVGPDPGPDPTDQPEPTDGCEPTDAPTAGPDPNTDEIPDCVDDHSACKEYGEIYFCRYKPQYCRKTCNMC